jgi:Outer membrane protein beta-barrel family/Carboxypeptidase regulatory-like domain
MKIFLLGFVLIVFANNLSAQTKPKVVPPPLPFREVSGIVKDSLDNAIYGATVIITSPKDSAVIATNSEGVFILKNIKSATFYITVRSLGFKTVTLHLLKSDIAPRLVLDPIILKDEAMFLKEVKIDGTPSVTYKTDTVEYRANDYIVRKDATIDELLKKMEGMEVASNGSLAHQGQPVTKAKLNGKEFSGGNVASAIKNLPADIVEKIQIVDDYGDEAARTGVKNGDPQKVLNITTKGDKSLGNTMRIYAGAGNNERYESRANFLRLNGNQTITLNGTLLNTVNGVGAGGGGTGGTINRIEPSFSYRDDLGKNVEVNFSYSYNYANINTINNTESQQFGAEGTTFLIYDGISDNNNRKHNLNAEIEYKIDSANFLKITPSVGYESSINSNNSTNFQTGVIHQDFISNDNNSSTLPNLAANVFYQHIFRKKGRNISINLNASNSDQSRQQEQRNIRTFYDGNPQQTEHYLITNDNLSNKYRVSMTYVEPLNVKTQLEFNGQLNYRGYDNNKVTNDINSSGAPELQPLLSNIFKYSFTENRFSLNYRYGTNLSKTNFSLGLTAVPSILEGTSVSLNTIIRRTSFNLIPIARIQYAWSRLKKISLNYIGNLEEPSFDQIQPVRDVSNPQNPVLGNPNLKASFRHSVYAQYNNYLANSKLNLSANINSFITKNQVSRNYILVTDPVYGRVYETQYLNMNGNHGVNGNYNIQKQLSNRKYILILNGTIGYNQSKAMSSNVAYTAITWRFNERFGFKINPVQWFEINPNISFDYTSSKYSLLELSNRSLNTLALNLDGQVDFLKKFRFSYNLNKNYVSGINANLTNNPFIINATIEKKIFKNEIGTVRLQVFDLLDQNNFINRTFTETGITDTRTNALSRYVMVGFRVDLQKWGGVPNKNGKPLRRRGDGSFIN